MGDPEAFRVADGLGAQLLGKPVGRQQYAEDALGPEGVGRESGAQRTVDASRESDDHALARRRQGVRAQELADG